LPWLDVLAITAWGILMLKYWLTGKLNLLIHYFWLVIAGDWLADCRWVEGWSSQRRYATCSSPQHITLFPWF